MMPEEQDNQIDRREPGGINRRSETARRGGDAASFVRGLANSRPESDPPNTLSTDFTYEFSLKWGTKGSEDGQFNRPVGIAVASDGSVYVADSYNGRVQKFTSEGVFVSQLDESGTGSGWFGRRFKTVQSLPIYIPYGIAVAPDSSLYVSDRDYNRIMQITSAGVLVRQWGTESSGDGEFNPVGVAVAPGGSVYVSDLMNNRVQKFTSGGAFVSKWGTWGTGDGEFRYPSALAVASDGSVYVADTDYNRIQKFSPRQ